MTTWDSRDVTRLISSRWRAEPARCITGPYLAYANEITVDMTPVRSPRRSKIASARSRTAVASARSGPIGEPASIIAMSPPEATAARNSLTRPAMTSPAIPRPPTGVVDHPDLAKGGRQLAIVVTLLGQDDGAPIRLFGAVEVDLHRHTAEGLAERAAQERLPELDVRSELGRAIASIERPGPNTSGELCRSVLVVAHPKGRRPPEHDVELELGIAHRLGKRCELGETVEPFTRTPEDGQRIVAGREEDPTIGRCRHHGECLLDESERLFGRVGIEGRRRGLDREARSASHVTGGQGVLRQHRQGGRRRDRRSRGAYRRSRRGLGDGVADVWLIANWRTCSWANV